MKNAAGQIIDVSLSPVILWGDSEKEVRSLKSALESIADVCRGSRDADTAAEARHILTTGLHGCATVLFVVPGASEDPVAVLRAFLVQSRDHETREGIKARRERGEAAAMIHNGRRGVLDTAVDEIDQALRNLVELEAEESRKAGR